MIIKNIKTNVEIDFNCKSDKILAQKLVSDPDFEVISMTDEEKELLVKEEVKEISLEDKLLGKEEPIITILNTIPKEKAKDKAKFWQTN